MVIAQALTWEARDEPDDEMTGTIGEHIISIFGKT